MAGQFGKRKKSPQEQGVHSLVIMPLHRDQRGERSTGTKSHRLKGNTMKRTLYECSHARVKGKRIYCDRGYLLSAKSGDGSLDIKRLARGDPLALAVCQGCADFDSMGPPVPQEERGWVKSIKKAARRQRLATPPHLELEGSQCRRIH